MPGRLLRETAPRVCAWIERMNRPVPRGGEFVAGDALPPSLLPLLRLIGRDTVPFLLDNLRAFEAWADAKPADLVEPPRGVGVHETSRRGARFKRVTSPYTQWQVREALADTGLVELLEHSPHHRLRKRAFKLAFGYGTS